jgi:hypothetical protein
MGAVGQTCKVTGFALSGISTLYLTNTLTSLGIGLLEYLPVMMSAGKFQLESFQGQMKTRNIVGWRSAGWLSGVLVTGIALRKIGTVVSDDSSINWTENFLYGNSALKTATDNDSGSTLE